MTKKEFYRFLKENGAFYQYQKKLMTKGFLKGKEQEKLIERYLKENNPKYIVSCTFYWGEQGDFWMALYNKLKKWEKNYERKHKPSTEKKNYS